LIFIRRGFLTALQEIAKKLIAMEKMKGWNLCVWNLMTGVIILDLLGSSAIVSWIKCMNCKIIYKLNSKKNYGLFFFKKLKLKFIKEFKI